MAETILYSMRIIGSIPHPRYKITVFKTSTRFPLQIEDRDLIQIYRLRQGGPIEGFADVMEWLTEERLDKATEIFVEMRQQMNAGGETTDPRKSINEDLPDIF
ncbi:MAG: hypothetical protein AAFY91_10660 [Bacteroidota bacterium]